MDYNCIESWYGTLFEGKRGNESSMVKEIENSMKNNLFSKDNLAELGIEKYEKEFRIKDGSETNSGGLSIYGLSIYEFTPYVVSPDFTLAEEYIPDTKLKSRFRVNPSIIYENKQYKSRSKIWTIYWMEGMDNALNASNVAEYLSYVKERSKNDINTIVSEIRKLDLDAKPFKKRAYDIWFKFGGIKDEEMGKALNELEKATTEKEKKAAQEPMRPHFADLRKEWCSRTRGYKWMSSTIKNHVHQKNEERIDYIWGHKETSKDAEIVGLVNTEDYKKVVESRIYLESQFLKRI